MLTFVALSYFKMSFVRDRSAFDYVQGVDDHKIEGALLHSVFIVIDFITLCDEAGRLVQQVKVVI